MPPGAFLPPAALQSEVNRTRVLLEQAEKEHQRALQSLSSAQQRVEHARNALVAKTAARDAAHQLKHDTELELQAAKVFAEYFAAAWERKENELAKASSQVHRSEVELKQANSAVEGVKKHALTALEVKEDSDKQLERAQRAHDKAKRKAEEAMARVRAEEEKQRAAEEAERKAAAEREESLKRAKEKAAAAAGPPRPPPTLPVPTLPGGGAIPGVVTADQLRELQQRASASLAATGGMPPNLLSAYPAAAHAAILAAVNGAAASPAAAAAPAGADAAAVAAAPAAEAGTPEGSKDKDKDKDAANGSAKRSSRHRSRSRSGSRERRRRRGSSRGRSRSRSKSRERKKRRSNGASKERSRSRERRRKRSRSRERRRSRSRDQKDTKDRKERRSGRDRSRSRSRSRGRDRGRDREQDKAERGRGERERDRAERDRPPPRAARLEDIDVPASVHDAFLRALVDSFTAKPPPFNVSVINDRMLRADRRWNAQTVLGCSFTQLCDLMERKGVLELRRLRDATEVVGSRHAESKAGVLPRPRLSPSLHSPRGADGGERWQMGED